jgi:hypothetical protein
MARFSRLLSRAYEVLFSISATLNSTEMCHAAIDIVNNDLESWRNSIPKRFRPCEPFQSEYFSEQSSMAVALRTHYHYYSVVIALSRISLHGDAGSTSQRQSKSKEALLNAARVIIELTRYIDTGDHHPVWYALSIRYRVTLTLIRTGFGGLYPSPLYLSCLTLSCTIQLIQTLKATFLF